MSEEQTANQPTKVELSSKQAAQLAACQKERAEYLAGWQRSRADLTNYKKEVGELLSAAGKFGQLQLIEKLLPILDHFDAAERALAVQQKQQSQGFLQIKLDLLKVLAAYGLARVPVVGQNFDPRKHEAVVEVKTAGQPPGIIIEELQAGYLLNNQLIRAARVKVTA